VTVYSHTRLGSFETCPRKYWYQYIGKPEIERVESVEAFLGSRVHDALEELYRRRMGGQIMAADELIAWFDARWESDWSDAVQIVRKQFSADDYREVGHESLQAYHTRHAPFDGSRTLRLEQSVAFNLDEAGQSRLKGFVDRLAQRSDGTYEVHDYKTSQHVPTQDEADADRQLALYQIGVQEMWPDATDVDLIWHYVRFDKEIRSRRTPEQLEAVKQRCIALIDDIESRGRTEEAFPTKPSNLCNWCDYRGVCPETRHHVAVEALPTEQFKADSGVKLVDLLAKLKADKAALNDQITALDAQIESVTETLIRLARQQGISSVCGSSHAADVRSKQRVIMPESGTSERDDLEAALKAAGLYDAVAIVNWQKLNSLWFGDSLPEEVRQSLSHFIRMAEETVVRLKKGGDGA